jgi:broad specificity phosphatase PhoE
MLELYMARHGQTDFSREHRFCGRIDPPLNEIGGRMAGALADAYGALLWDGIYVSPRRRAIDTASPLAARMSTSPELDEGLGEIAYGEWEGLLPEEARAKWPEQFALWSESMADRAPPGGETAFDVAARAAKVLDRVRRAHPDGRVLLVSHKGTLRILICALLGIDVRLFRERIDLPVGSVTRFQIGPTGALLTTHGDVSHLPMDLRHLPGT